MSKRTSWGWVDGLGRFVLFGCSCRRPARRRRGPSLPRRRAGKKGTPAVAVNVAELTEKLKRASPPKSRAALAEAKRAGKGAAPLAPSSRSYLREAPPRNSPPSRSTRSAPRQLKRASRRHSRRTRTIAIRRLRKGSSEGDSSRPGAPWPRRAARRPSRIPTPGVRGIAASGLGTFKAAKRP